jgi:hypothetical protein
MIRINFTEPCTTVWKKWREKCTTEQATLNGVYAAGKSGKVSGKLYRERKDLYFALEGPFHGKCAYCETLIVVSHPGDLDHFRPKGRVTKFSGTVTLKDKRGRDVPHPGYYWLAYDFRNLLPSCEDCNRPNKARSGGLRIGKWDLFPVKGSYYAENPGEEKLEKPLLINPTDKKIKIEKHLTVDDKGVVTFHTDKGETCCKVFGLNDRQALVQERMVAYRNGYHAVLNFFVARGNDNVTGAEINLKTIIEYEAGISPYSAAGRSGIDAMCKKLGVDKNSIIPKMTIKRRKSSPKEKRSHGREP